tara:strand:+ start:458 stop:979 length:522 start_codon:yes stop_codon:yes gene_type:complete
MAINHGYIGRAPSDSSVTVARQTFSVSGVTTDFTFTSGYNVGYFDVYINGAKLINGTDYVASDTSTFSILSGGAADGDVIEAVAYKAFNLGQAGSVGVSSGGLTIGQAETLNFVGTGNTFAVNGSTIDVSISSGSASQMVIPTRSGTAVTFNIPSTDNFVAVVGRSSTINVPV